MPIHHSPDSRKMTSVSTPSWINRLLIPWAVALAICGCTSAAQSIGTVTPDPAPSGGRECGEDAVSVHLTQPVGTLSVRATAFYENLTVHSEDIPISDPSATDFRFDQWLGIYTCYPADWEQPPTPEFVPVTTDSNGNHPIAQPMRVLVSPTRYGCASRETISPWGAGR